MSFYRSIMAAISGHLKKISQVFPILAFAGVFVSGTQARAQTYDLPDDNAGCPANCRQISWRAGSDLWTGGTLPNYTPVICNGLTEGNGTKDNTAAIQSCIDSLGPQKAAVIPPGTYYVNGTLSIRSNTVLRGSGSTDCAQGTWISSTYSGDTGRGSTCTTLKYGPGGSIQLSGSYSRGSTVPLSAGYTKGSTTLVTASSPGVSVNDWIIVSEKQGDTDPVVTWNGGHGNCTWCGETDNTGYIMTQIVQVTSVSGNTIGISRPLYYTFKSSLMPHIMRLSMGSQKAGVEDMKLWGSSNSRTAPHIRVSGCTYCWIKGVETYNTPNVAKAYPVLVQYSYGNEIRDSYFHYGQGNGSDRNYGLGFFGPNSDHKIENNILRENRHSYSYEGGGSGIAFLYNYVDDNYSDDPSYLGAPYSNHGGHPYMNLFEGNIISHFVADNYWGSSSHTALFRNWLWGDESGRFSGFGSSSPSWGFVALEIGLYQTYYSAVGNVLGNPGLHANWNSATVFSPSCSWGSSRTSPVVYGLGCDSSSQGGPYQAAVRNSTILHGNYDYKTGGVAFWDGGAAHTLKPSMYYMSKPAFFGSCAWPAFGPDLTPITNTLPAKARFEGSAACSGTIVRPSPPTNLRVTVR